MSLICSQNHGVFWSTVVLISKIFQIFFHQTIISEEMLRMMRLLNTEK